MLFDPLFLNFAKDHLVVITAITIIALVWLVAIIEGNNFHQFPEAIGTVSTYYLVALYILIFAIITELVLSRILFTVFIQYETVTLYINLVLSAFIVITSAARAYLFASKYGMRQSAIVWAIPAIYLVFVLETMFMISL